MAFGRGSILRVHINGIVGTRLHAGLAANAAVGIEVDNSILALVHRRHGTNRDARGFLAMVTARDLKDAARVGKHALLYVFHPGSVDAHRYLVLGFARHGASMTTDALAIVDYESVFHPYRSLDPKNANSSYLSLRAMGVMLLRGDRLLRDFVGLDLIIDVFNNPLHRFGERLPSAGALQFPHSFR
jgi:hypothetical protein